MKQFKQRFQLRNALFILPNAFTVSSIFCGMYAILHSLTGNSAESLYEAGIAVFFAGFFDTCDGRVARITKTQSEFGVQLDSLADVISFGVAPALLVYKWALWPLGPMGFLGAFFYAACGAIRLARFNVISAREKGEAGEFFMGLPIPLAAAVLVASLVAHLKLFAGSPVKHPEWILYLILLMGILMISTVEYWTFKKSKFNRQTALTLLILLTGTWWFRLHYPISLGVVGLLGIYIVAGISRYSLNRLYWVRKE
ncbi:MAG: CDP-diacylglycerol--serine O-phosphatidyltransferase [Myxococcaceae bacterium]|nr:CDP-diacylglycerol--serine O-phosphatidyltransferase [Myxococcaceae bacterium]MBH2006900.1 CDP-diacylglycerol--serine O-phosphatidyltransferase [Myxococcaceae bacterium]